MIRQSDALNTENALQSRSKIFFYIILAVFVVVLLRLFYWQIIQGSALQAEAEEQYSRSSTKIGSRGYIYTVDGHALVTNKRVYRSFAQPQTINQEPVQISKLITPILLKDFDAYQEASSEAQKQVIALELENDITAKLSKKESKWVSLLSNIS
ncbi:MAG: hypothetical protein QG639_581, partial [Patescibacteria group bacterium]|nr:hypothetical protein [Patescibacteria group bacterium]